MCNRYNYLGSASISIILGIIIGVLVYFGFIPNIQSLLITALVFAGINYILYTLISVFRNINRNRNDNENNNNRTECNSCRCRYQNGIITGIIGTILFGILSFGLTLTTGIIITAILVGIFFVFLIFMIINIYLFLICLNEDCSCNCNCGCNCSSNTGCNCNNNNNSNFNYNYTNLNNY